ncbi:RNA polymerase sigma factor SigJ [Streptomonospora salina]|uniref:RNA polymerase sigma-70 factor (ECF subfamily) n=1 Tax=Streptomonospora salina TaxID=104205 RepID=A0A841EB42_9ACTN|nr:RNA polymerase sigma factor SigJ [Streptomonospora salina]MBB5998283.1 RNA polymerase sigma-70 factor (ECF subfamily) [Streptomonospora salina]
MAVPEADAAKAALFDEQRPRMLGLAYRMLGSAAEAEDAVQDAYLRWNAADTAAVRVPAAWLTKVVTNLCLNRLTSAQATRESYIGPWLPEPVLIDDGALGPLETAEQRDSVSVGVLVVLERLTPPERAVFVLREAFGHTHREIADLLDVGEDHSRQLLRRAREHVNAPRRRFAADTAQQRRIVERFFAATVQGDVRALERMLAEDAVAWSDGGGATRAARRPISGRAKVARYLAAVAALPEAEGLRAEAAEVNGESAGVLRIGGELIGVVWLEADSGGRVAAVRAVLNPGKLAYFASQTGTGAHGDADGAPAD